MAVFTHTVPPKFLIQIGDMTVSFATLEFMMRQIFLVLVGQSAVVGMILGSFLSFKNLGSAINSLHRARFGEDGLYSELKDLLAQAAKLEEDRNVITHSIWMAHQTQSFITRHKVTARSKGGFKATFKQYTEDDLSAFVQSIKVLTGKFADFYQKLPSKVPS